MALECKSAVENKLQKREKKLTLFEHLRDLCLSAHCKWYWYKVLYESHPDPSPTDVGL